MELNELATREKHEAGAEMQVVNPNTGEKTDFFIMLYVPDCDHMTALQKDHERHSMEVMFGNKEDTRELDIEKAVAAIKSWHGLTEGGSEVKFTKRKAEKLLSESPPIKKQILNFFGNRVNFNSTASKN
ncbi:MAG: hypothetical protein MI864_00345 [Pseudomonadales bacterium]|nr:hypothetical protein [Pseudomonadales bacterium]